MKKLFLILTLILTITLTSCDVSDFVDKLGNLYDDTSSGDSGDADTGGADESDNGKDDDYLFAFFASL